MDGSYCVSVGVDLIWGKLIATTAAQRQLWFIVWEKIPAGRQWGVSAHSKKYKEWQTGIETNPCGAARSLIYQNWFEWQVKFVQYSPWFLLVFIKFLLNFQILCGKFSVKVGGKFRFSIILIHNKAYVMYVHKQTFSYRVSVVSKFIRYWRIHKFIT
jgi:hypothetical protein